MLNRIKNKITKYFNSLNVGRFLCKIGIHDHDYIYTTSMSGWTTYDGYCGRCGHHTSGLL